MAFSIIIKYQEKNLKDIHKTITFINLPNKPDFH